MKKLGLALGGGGARGCAHVGVIKALQEANIPIACVAGTSMGAVVGGVFASGHLKHLEDYLSKITWTDVLTQFDPTVGNDGMFKGKKVLQLIEKLTGGKSFSDCQIPFVCTATNLMDGQAVRLSEGKLSEAIRASISLPGILMTVEKEGKHLLDGGITNPLPVDLAKQLGADVVLAVDVSQQYVHEKRRAASQKDEKGWGIGRWASSSYPSMIDVIEGSMFLMQKVVTEKNLEQYPADLLLTLNLSAARLFDFQKAKTLIKEGYEATKKVIPELRGMIE